MKGERSVVKEALEDVEKIRELAVEAAKEQLVNKMAPSIKMIVEKAIKQSFEDADRLRRAADGYGETEFEEGKSSKGDLNMKRDELEQESMLAMFPGLAEVEEPEQDMEEAKFEMPGAEEEGEVEEMSIPTLGEGEEEECGEEEKEEVDEEVTVDEVALAKAYESIRKASNALQKEVKVSSGFADSYKKTAWNTEDGKPSDTGLLDKEGGEKDWSKGQAMDKKDYSVKEAIEKGLKENAELKKYVMYLEGQLDASKQVINTLKTEVHKVNLFNTKVLKVNEMLNKYGKSMTNEQKRVVLEKIDGAKTVNEVKIVAEAFKAALTSISKGKVNESARKPKANAQRVLKSGAPDQKVLRESVDKSETNQWGRIQQLAGLVE